MRFRIDLKIFIFLIIFYLTKQIELYAMMMFFALIHEFGHLIAGLLLGMRPEKLELMPFGVSIAFKIAPREFNKKIRKGNLLEIKKIMVALAGPLTNFIVILVICKLKLDMVTGLEIIYTNFLIMLFNLLPIFPLDGGRILKGILHIYLGKCKAEEYVSKVSMILVVIIIIVSSVFILSVHNVSIFLVDMYLLYLVIREDLKYSRRKVLFDNFK